MIDVEPTPLSDLVEQTGSPQADRYGDPEDEPGFIVAEQDEGKVARGVARLWETQNPLMKRHLAQVRVNELRRKGFTSVYLTKDPESGWSHYVPPGAGPDTNPTTNKAATVCRKAEGVLFADPPKADPVAPSGDDEDLDRREFVAALLEDLHSPGQLNTPKRLRKAWGRGCSAASTFIRYFLDPKGMRAPLRIEAAPFAGHVDEALRNPLTNAAWTPADAAAFGQQWDGQYKERFVAEDGALTDEESEAATRWEPVLRSEIVTSRNVRLMPHTTEDVSEAHGAIVHLFLPWGSLKRMHPEKLARLPRSSVDQLLQWRPEQAEDINPRINTRDSEPDHNNRDETLCSYMLVYYTACEEYPQGAYAVVAGGSMLIERGPWGAEVNGRWETFHIPLAQVKQFAEGDPEWWGHGMMELVGPGNELLAAVWGSYLDHLEQLLSRNTYVPTNSIIHPSQIKNRRHGGSIIPINPGGQPVFEELPDYPREGMQVIPMIGEAIDHASGLESLAQGIQDPSVGSGRHAEAIIGQVHAGLSELTQNITEAFVRCCAIELQLIRANYASPRQLRWRGADGKHRQKAWMGADLGDTMDVRIKAGTMTLLAPSQKAGVAREWASLGVLQPHELKEMLVSNMGGVLGLEDDPHRLRVRRQISDWRDGPPKVDPMALQAYQQQMAGYRQTAATAVQIGAVDPATGDPLGPDGAPVRRPPHPYQPALAAIFDPRPVDMQPDVATIRMVELGKAMATEKYSSFPPEWRMGLDMEYNRAALALQPPPQPASPPLEGEPKAKAA